MNNDTEIETEIENDTEIENNEDINNIIHFKAALESSFFYLDNDSIKFSNEKFKDYCRIIQEMNNYLKKYCNHKIIDDWIDTDPDNGGQNIKYCTKCFMTF
jgi:hypothetical protein